MSEAQEAVVQEAPTTDNSTIRQMREQIDTSTKAAADAIARANEAEAKLQEIERAKLDETERLRLEAEDAKKVVSELTPLKDQLSVYESKFKSMFESDLAKLDEDKREMAEKLADGDNWADRYDKLQALGAFTGVGKPLIGSQTQPGAPGSANPQVKTYTNIEVARGEVPLTFKSIEKDAV